MVNISICTTTLEPFTTDKQMSTAGTAEPERFSVVDVVSKNNYSPDCVANNYVTFKCVLKKARGLSLFLAGNVC